MSPKAFEWILQSFARRAPFQPFVIAFVDGERIEIRHPEAVGYWQNIVMFRNQHGAFQLFSPDAICRVGDLEAEDELEL